MLFQDRSRPSQGAWTPSFREGLNAEGVHSTLSGPEPLGPGPPTSTTRGACLLQAEGLGDLLTGPAMAPAWAGPPPAEPERGAQAQRGRNPESRNPQNPAFPLASCGLSVPAHKGGDHGAGPQGVVRKKNSNTTLPRTRLPVKRGDDEAFQKPAQALPKPGLRGVRLPQKGGHWLAHLVQLVQLAPGVSRGLWGSGQRCRRPSAPTLLAGWILALVTGQSAGPALCSGPAPDLPPTSSSVRSTAGRDPRAWTDGGRGPGRGAPRPCPAHVWSVGC